MSAFEELKKNIESKSNSNFYFDKMDLVTRIWISGVCDLIDAYPKKKSCSKFHEMHQDKDDLCPTCGKPINENF